MADPDTGELILNAEVAFTVFASTTRPVTAQPIVRRVRHRAKQAELVPVWRYHPFVTDTTEPVATADTTHRRHAIIETPFADLIDGPLAHQPSGRLAAHHAWAICAAPSFVYSTSEPVQLQSTRPTPPTTFGDWYACAECRPLVESTMSPLVFLAGDELGGTSTEAAVLYGGVGIGLLLGYVLLARAGRRWPAQALLIAGFVVSSAGNLVTGLAGSIMAAMLLQTMRGAGIGALDVGVNTHL